MSIEFVRLLFPPHGGLLTAVLLLSVLSGTADARTWQHEQGALTLDTVPQRVVTLNWAATEAVLSLGVTPVGIADRDGYSHWVTEPELPDGVYNVGSRTAPSLEAIAELKPDLIVTSSEMSPAAQLLEAIAPTYVISVYKNGRSPYTQGLKMLRTLGAILGREAQADAVIADVEQSLAENRHRLEQAGLTDRPIALISFLDGRHVRINTPNGMLNTTLTGLGLANAWHQEGNFWGFSVIGLDTLAPLENARIVVISPTLPGLSGALANSPFWTHLPSVRQQQVYQVDPVWTFGGIHPVKRLADLLTATLLAGGNSNVH